MVACRRFLIQAVREIAQILVSNVLTTLSARKSSERSCLEGVHLLGVAPAAAVALRKGNSSRITVTVLAAPSISVRYSCRQGAVTNKS